MTREEAKRLFEVWFRDPIYRMGPNDGFIAMMVALPLFEWLIAARNPDLENSHDRNYTKALIGKVGEELSLSEDCAGIFWQTVCDGLMHGAMPKAKIRENKEQNKPERLVTWYFNTDFPERPVIAKRSDSEYRICIDPIKFARYVVDEFLQESKRDPDVFGRSTRFPFADVVIVDAQPPAAAPDKNPADIPQWPSPHTQATGVNPNPV